MLHSVFRVVFLVLILLFTTQTATAVQDEFFLAQMKVTREINLGSVYEYEVEAAGRGLAIFKTPPYRLKKGEAINFFVVEGAKEKGKPAYMGLMGYGGITDNTINRAGSFSDGMASVRLKDGWVFIDKNGRTPVQAFFADTTNFHNGFALGKVGNMGEWMIVGKDGKLLKTRRLTRPGDYGSTWSGQGNTNAKFSDGVLFMKSPREAAKDANDNFYMDNFSMLDGNGAIIKDIANFMALRNISPLSEGLAAIVYVTKYPKYGNGDYVLFGYIDKSCNLIIPAQYEYANSFKDGVAAVLVKDNDNDLRGKWGFIDKSGKFVIEPKFEYTENFSEGRAIIRTGRYLGDYKYGFIDKDGKVVVNPSYDEVLPFCDGLAAVRREKTWGYIDKNGQVVVKFLYASAKSFANGLAPVLDKQFRGTWGYIDKSGKYAIKSQYKTAESFYEGLAAVSEEGPGNTTKWKYINNKGQAAIWFYLSRNN